MQAKAVFCTINCNKNKLPKNIFDACFLLKNGGFRYKKVIINLLKI